MVVATSPPLKTFMAGIEVIWYFIAWSGFSSTLSFTTVILSEFSAWIWSSTGETMRHGPHHSAQKSTSTGPSALSTSRSKVADVVACAFRVSSLGSDCGEGRLVVVERGQVVCGVERRDGAARGGRDGLAVGGVADVARGEHAGHRGPRRAAIYRDRPVD